MTGNKSFFTNFIEFSGGNATFGDDKALRVKDKGTIFALNIPTFKEVLYVESLKANLISISQMCKNEFNVQFSQSYARYLTWMVYVWTRIFHVRPHSIGETRFLFICENLIF